MKLLGQDPSKDQIVSSLVSLEIQVIGVLIPWLGTLISFPGLNLLAIWGIGVLTSRLVDRLTLYIKFRKIDETVRRQVANTKIVIKALWEIQKNPKATKEEKRVAFEAFKRAMGALTKIDSLGLGHFNRLRRRWLRLKARYFRSQ